MITRIIILSFLFFSSTNAYAQNVKIQSIRNVGLDKWGIVFIVDGKEFTWFLTKQEILDLARKEIDPLVYATLAIKEHLKTDKEFKIPAALLGDKEVKSNPKVAP